MDPSIITTLLNDLDAKPAKIRYGASKRLMQLSESNPADLYPHWDRFVEQLNSPFQILRWNTARILGNLVSVDAKRKFDAIFVPFFAPITGHSMISAANVIGASPPIVNARPDLAPKILPILFKVSKAAYQTSTCRDIAIGHACVALGEMKLSPQEKTQALKFAKSHLANDRNATRLKAQKLIRKLEKP